MISVLVFLLAGAVVGFTGFGFNLISVPLLALVMPVREAVGLALLAGVAVNGMMALRHRADAQWRALARVTPSVLLGMTLGVATSASMPTALLQVVVGALTVVLAVYLAVRPPLRPVRPNRVVVSIAGGLSGALMSVTGMGGPPMVAYLTHAVTVPFRVRSSMAVYSTATSAVALGGLALADAVPSTALRGGVIAVLASLLGMWGGSALFRVLPSWYPRVVTATLVVAAVAGAALALA